MKAFTASILMLGLVQGTTYAQQGPPAVQAAAKPSEASIEQLLQVMRAKSLIEQTVKQVDTVFANSLNKMLDGKQPTAQDQQAIANARARIKEVTDQLLTWEVLEPVYLHAYQDSFSQEEIDSMIGFYSSPAGQAVIAKLPLVMQNAMAGMQNQMNTLIPKVQQIAKETATQIRSQHDQDTKHSAG